MRHSSKLQPWLLAACIIAIGASSIAWYQDSHTPAVATTIHDTVPKREKKVREKNNEETVISGDLEESLKQVERARVELQQQLDSKQWKKMHEQLAQSLEKMNVEKIQTELQQALKNIEEEKINLKAQRELRQIDMEKMHRDLQKSLEEAKTSSNYDSDKMKQLVEKAMVESKRALQESKKAMDEYRKIGMEKIKKELDISQQRLIEQQSKIKVEMERAREEIQEAMKKDYRKELEQARAGVTRAKEELQNYKNMLQEMEKDGLLNTRENYKVEYKNGDLFINGKQQPAGTADKYKHYFKKDNVTIKHEEDDDKTIRL
jgi:DNA repair exonuclease SbcCD ATPase subunit